MHKNMTVSIFEKDETYLNWFSELKVQIRQAQMQAVLKVNETLLELYWTIGKSIIEKQKEMGWGAKVIEALATDLKHSLPDNKGFSSRNLKYMQLFAREYPHFPFVQEVLAQMENVQVPLAQITWYHHITLITAVKNIKERVFYIQKTIENGWSRNVMLMQIENKFFERQGKALSNFQNTLPPPQSDLASSLFKDPYNFDFITLKEKSDEKDIENQLVQKITELLLELGKGFAYVGRQYPIKVEKEDYYIDLLFYHLKLRSYIVIELKASEFKPEYIGKLNFYLSTVDSQLNTEFDMPAIGLLLCKTKNSIKVEYALRNMTKPIGVSEYNTIKNISKKIRSQLPSIDDIELKMNEI